MDPILCRSPSGSKHDHAIAKEDEDEHGYWYGQDRKDQDGEIVSTIKIGCCYWEDKLSYAEPDHNPNHGEHNPENDRTPQVARLLSCWRSIIHILINVGFRHI